VIRQYYKYSQLFGCSYIVQKYPITLVTLRTATRISSIFSTSKHFVKVFNLLIKKEGTNDSCCLVRLIRLMSTTKILSTDPATPVASPASLPHTMCYECVFFEHCGKVLSGIVVCAATY
jgi:hypothetical protein